MIKEYIGLNEISGSLVVLDGVKNAGYEEVVEFNVANGERRRGRIIKIDGERVVAQVFEGTKGLSLTNTATVPTGSLPFTIR
jgi:V/A-type H+-transporting ATPase subunit B